MKTIKVRLKPTNEQLPLFHQSSGTHRFIYNWTLAKQQDNYKQGGQFINDGELRKEITQLKKQEAYQWLSQVSNDIPKQAIKDACLAYRRFFKGRARFPRFKSKKRSKWSFYNDTAKLKVKDHRVLLAKIGWVKTSESIPKNQKYYNPRVSFDGKYWYLSVSINVDMDKPQLSDESLGIDLGIKTLAVCSNGQTFKNINKTHRIKQKEKRLRRLQRKVSRKYQMNKKGGNVVKTCNIIKIEKEIRLLQRSLSNIRRNHLHQTTTSIVKTKPTRIVIEDLNVRGMMKNKHLAKAIQNQGFYEFRRQLTYKCDWYGIELVVADRYYSSSKTCSSCGAIKKDLRLSNRTYICECGHQMDRDLNASINLANYQLVS
ncbi:RNA-guided endonuclease InsQ/TnpB family protein [Staphylococcus aureus]|uniref:RNA-guided endonuclease InsQ/TnpB family protein n=1 Tax=Staphylococcus aureus TaxID=1280 RepID=UPI0005E479CB|nr:RNA-guided endonuclease TnpB family protein [Staphylococcus aureus]CFH41538.1 putative transposase [Staphylococcus aureus]